MRNWLVNQRKHENGGTKFFEIFVAILKIPQGPQVFLLQIIGICTTSEKSYQLQAIFLL